LIKTSMKSDDCRKPSTRDGYRPAAARYAIMGQRNAPGRRGLGQILLPRQFTPLE
jgi:hypothetical protein